ncbi:MAG TPA: glycosyltransferase family 4 protein [Mycobacteriales bacterium]|nr:glycosyltransferase family 4 protein [Mycobacteriales bacterium]
MIVYTDSTGVGGAEISLEHLVREAPAAVDVVVAGTSRPIVERIAAVRPGARALVVRRGALAHAAAFAALRPDVVHLNRSVPWATAAAACAALSVPDTRLVTVDQLPLRTTHAALLWRTRALTLRADVAVAVGRVSARRVEDFYALGPGSVVSVPNGVPPVDAVPSVPSRTGELRVGSLGRRDPMKGYDVALRALARIEGVRLLVHGTGGEAPRLTALARALGIADRVEWREWISDRAAALGGFEVLVLPSRTEGFSLSLVEAMSAGLPCVATNVGGAAEAFDEGRCGLLVPPDDPVALAAALVRLRDDPAGRERLGSAARERARALYTATRMASAYLDLWTQAVSRPRRPRLRVPPPTP